jgi:hypothetical protein
MDSQSKPGSLGDRIKKPADELVNHLAMMCLELADHEKLLPPGSLEKLKVLLQNVTHSLHQVCEEFSKALDDKRKQFPPGMPGIN